MIRYITVYKEIFRLNSRFRRAVMERRPKGAETVDREKYDQLVNENQLLGMKVRTIGNDIERGFS